MGIKDNFSQAVKELWKNDKEGMEQQTGAPQAEAHTQLDQYLQQQNAAIGAEPADSVQQSAPVQTAQPAAPVQPAPAINPQPAVNTNPQTEHNAAGIPLETPYYPNEINKPVQQPQTAAQPSANAAQAAPINAQPVSQAAAPAQQSAPVQTAQPQGAGYGFGGNKDSGFNANSGFNSNSGFGGNSYVPPASGNANVNRAQGVTDEVTVISKNTVIDGNVRSLANMQVDGNIKGNVETTRDIEMSGKVVGDIKCDNANMSSAAMQGNLTTKGKMRMDRDTILIGDLSSNYADVNGRIRGKLEISGKAELKRDAIVFGDINASTIAVTDGAIIQGYVNTTFLSKEDGRNAFPEAITFDAGKDPNVK